MYRKDILSQAKPSQAKPSQAKPSQALGELRPFCGPFYRTVYSTAAIPTEPCVSVEIAAFCDFVRTLRNEEVYHYG